MTNYRFPAFVAVALASIVAHPAFASDDQKAENPLLRPPGAPDPDASGQVRTEIDVDKNRHRLKVEAEKIDTMLTFELYLQDAGGVLQNVGVLPLNGSFGEVEIEFDTKEGPPLPFAATNVNTLAGRNLEVRSGGVAYLTGVVPSPGGGGSGGGGGATDLKVKQFMTRASTSPDTNASGYIELRSKGVGDQKFKVEADHIDPVIAFSVWVETGLGSGVFANAGAMGPEDFDDVELELETEDGALLPNAATDVAMLAGLRVEVRDATNVVYLEGLVPALSGSGGGGSGSGNQKAKAEFAGSGGKVELELKRKNNSSQEFEFEVKKLKVSTAVTLFVFDSTSATFALVSAISLNGGGNGKYKVETKKGQPLPLGVLLLSNLGNKAFEVRDATSGTVLVAGTIPQL